MLFCFLDCDVGHGHSEQVLSEGSACRCLDASALLPPVALRSPDAKYEDVFYDSFQAHR